MTHTMPVSISLIAAHRLVQAHRVDVRSQAEAGVVGQGDGLVQTAHLADRRDRSERLPVQNLHVGKDAGEDGGLLEEARLHAHRPRATARQTAPLLDGPSQDALVAVPLPLVHHRAHVDVPESIADPDLASLLDEESDELVVHVLMHVEALCRRAHLTGVQECGEGSAAGRHRERGRRHDDEGVVPGRLDQVRLEGCPRMTARPPGPSARCR